MPADDDRPDDVSPDERDQPVRDDLIDPDDIDPEQVREPTMDEVEGDIPSREELPESQGADVLDAERLTEDGSTRRLLSDEEAENEGS